VNWRKTTLEKSGKKKVTASTLCLRTITVIVHKNVVKRNKPNKWLLTCSELGIHAVELQSDKLGSAKTEAMNAVRNRTKSIRKELKELRDRLN
jgi:hypothetical protein